MRSVKCPRKSGKTTICSRCAILFHSRSIDASKNRIANRECCRWRANESNEGERDLGVSVIQDGAELQNILYSNQNCSCFSSSSSSCPRLCFGVAGDAGRKLSTFWQRLARFPSPCPPFVGPRPSSACAPIYSQHCVGSMDVLEAAAPTWFFVFIFLYLCVCICLVFGCCLLPLLLCFCLLFVCFIEREREYAYSPSRPFRVWLSWGPSSRCPNQSSVCIVLSDVVELAKMAELCCCGDEVICCILSSYFFFSSSRIVVLNLPCLYPEFFFFFVVLCDVLCIFFLFIFL